MKQWIFNLLDGKDYAPISRWLGTLSMGWILGFMAGLGFPPL